MAQMEVQTLLPQSQVYPFGGQVQSEVQLWTTPPLVYCLQWSFEFHTLGGQAAKLHVRTVAVSGNYSSHDQNVLEGM